MRPKAMSMMGGNAELLHCPLTVSIICCRALRQRATLAGIWRFWFWRGMISNTTPFVSAKVVASSPRMSPLSPRTIRY